MPQKLKRRQVPSQIAKAQPSKKRRGIHAATERDRVKSSTTFNTRDEITRLPNGSVKIVIVQQPNNGPWYEERLLMWLPNPKKPTTNGPCYSPKSFDVHAPCPMHRAVDILRGREDEQAKNILKKFYVKKSYLANGFKKGEDGEWEHHIFELKRDVRNAISGAIDANLDDSNKDAEGFVTNCPIVGPANLFPIIHDRTGEGLDTKYGASIINAVITLPPESLRRVKDIENFPAVKSVEEIELRVCLELGIDSIDDLEYGQAQRYGEDSVEDVFGDVDDPDVLPGGFDAGHAQSVSEEEDDPFEGVTEMPTCFGEYKYPNKKMRALGGCKQCPHREECRDEE